MKEVIVACGAENQMLHANNCNQIVSGMVAVMYDAAGGPASGTASRLCLPRSDAKISRYSEKKLLVGYFNTKRCRISPYLRR